MDTAAVVAVNDAYTMAHWGATLQAPPELLMLADGNGEFTRLIGMEQDLRAHGMGLRSQRYALIVKNGTVKYVGVDPTELDQSSVESILHNI